MRPLKFHPILKQTLWGGERIIPYKELASELSRVGESWELSGMPGSESVVAEGPWTGSTLPELIGRFGAELLGKANYARFGQEFPLLVKFIDAREDLSIQVHPDDELARKRHGKSGKCEMWYVLEAEPGASLLTGFSRPIAPAEYERRVADNTLTDVLNRQAIASGDVFYLPAGRVHSIGKGSFIVEIQQSSDITYRIYDFDRRDAAGNSRELHTELAREAIDFESSENSRITYAPENNQEVRLVTNALLYYVAIYPDRTNTLRLVGNGLFRGNSSASGEWFIDRQRRQSNRCPAGRNLVVARIDAMDRNHSAYSAPAPTDKPDLENPEFK